MRGFAFQPWDTVPEVSAMNIKWEQQVYVQEEPQQQPAVSSHSPKNMHIRLIGESKLPPGVCVCNDFPRDNWDVFQHPPTPNTPSTVK